MSGDSRPSYFGELHDDSSRPQAAAVSVEVSPLVYFHDLLTVLENIEENDDNCTIALSGIKERIMNKHVRARRLRKTTLSTREEVDGEEGRIVGATHTRQVYSFLNSSYCND